MRSLASLASLAAALSACSSEIHVAETSGTTGAGGTSSATTTGGAGGVAPSTGGGGAGGASADAGPPPACDPSAVFFDISGDGPVQHYDPSCAPDGHLSSAGPLEATLSLSACPKAPADPFLIGAFAESFPGTSLSAEARYLHAGVVYADNHATLTVTTLEPQGGVIEGTFATTVAPPSPDGGVPLALAGQFRVCHGPDSFGVCASPDTPIATPAGDVPIADLAPGDLVYSADREAAVAVPILRVSRTPVHDHHVVRIRLGNGAVLEISPGHPTADGRTVGALRAGDLLDGHLVVSVALVPYRHAFTFDILPASETGAYYAGGALVGSTLRR